MRDQLPAWIDIHRITPGQHMTGCVVLSRSEDWPAEDASVSLELDVVQASSGRLGLKGKLGGQTQLQCQRCLEPMAVAFETDFEVELVTSEAQAQRVSEQMDVYVAQEGRIYLHELVREESVLALPMMPRHREGACQPPGDTVIE